jgi:hypothetical protein
MSESYKIRYDSSKEKTIESIHLDDTIDSVKRKIIKELDSNIAYDNMYLYAVQETSFSPERLFKELTQNGKLELTHKKLMGFLLNFEDTSLMTKLERKDIYTIGDLYDLRLNNPHLVNMVIGQRFIGAKGTAYPFTVNPLKIQDSSDLDDFLLENASSMISTQNGNLLMNYGKIHNNTIFVLTGEEVLRHLENKQKEVVSIYFPFLEKREITTLEKLEEERENLLEQNRELLNKNVERSFESVNLFYEMYKNSQYPTKEKGVKDADFFIHQSLDMIIPLEQLFKILHASKGVPFIKYNPGFRRENLLRLYTDAQTFNGTKIPFLSKAMIIKLIKSVGRNKTISMFLDSNIVCTIFENGGIRVLYEVEGVESLDEIEERIRLLINPIMNEIKKYVEKSGFTYNLFGSFADENVEIVTMTYETSVKLDKKFVMDPYMSCISTLFNITQNVIGKEGGIQGRYKRVAYYNEMNAIDSFIREVINQGNQREGVIEKLRDNFDMTRDEAEARFINFINEVEVEQGVYQNRKLKIKDNPGFATSFVMKKFTTELIITISNINSVGYLEVIPIYLSSLVEMVQQRQEDLVKPLCSRTPILEEAPVEEIVALPEQPFSENETPVVTAAKELVFDDEGDDDMLDMLLGSDDEEDEDEDEEGMVGGGKDDMQDITGMSLANPNYFSKRMEDRDPSLFLKKKTGKFNAYSRMCPSNIRRQPVILTEEEKERIDKTHPGSYTHSIKYGSDPENPYYYICPRYWCIPENTSLSEEEVKAGACGGMDAIIPFDAKKVPKGKTIYEFGADPSDPSAHAYKEYYDEDGNYVTHYPGFIPGSKHPDGKCMPCCFKSWDAKEQVRRRQECAQDESGKKQSVPKRRKYVESQKDYIKGEEKFPLEPQRWGYLPLPLQMFFDEDVRNVQVSAINPVLKEDAVTLLRQGVEAHPTQSFIACIADIYTDYSSEDIKTRMDKQLKVLRKKLKEIRKSDITNKDAQAEKVTREIQKLKRRPTIKEMKKHIMEMLTIDNFSKYQNGNLVSEFYPNDVSQEVNIDDYQDSELYKQIDTTNEAQMDYFERVILSFKNFLAFLSDDEVVIDYQYLWDIISMPNDALFPNGINLVIFEIPDDDVTGNVEIICPTNHYSNVLFSDKRLSLLLVKKDNFFEPIYLYDNLKKDVNRFMFREQNLAGKPNIKLALSNVREYLLTKCKPLNSLPKIYTFTTNVSLIKVIESLQNHIKKIEAIVVNYNGKAVGVYVETKEGEKGFVPCYPSSYEVTSKTPIMFMDSTDYLSNYTQTIAFLNKIHSLTKLPCVPQCKITEDGLVVGILTKTNQMVAISPPEPIMDDDLDVCSTAHGKTHGINKIMITDKSKDTKRIDFMNALEREKEGYTAFRNLARIELNRYKNQELKKAIQDAIEKVDKDSLESYTETLMEVATLFKKLLRHIVAFRETPDIDNYVFADKNFMTDKDNEAWYFIRLSDEALRYQRIKLFLFEKDKYLSFTSTIYELNDDEILVLESMITSEFFEGLTAFKRNKYVHFNTYDTAEPILTAPYSETISIEKCVITTKPVSGKYLSQIFTPDYSVINFGGSKKNERLPLCSFEMMLMILKHEGKKMEKRELQQVLVEKYSAQPEEKVLKILYNEGKEQWVKMIRGRKLELEEFILSEHYYLTFLDIWMLSSVFKTPILFFGQYIMNVNKKKAFATTIKSKAYYVIRSYAPTPNTIPVYSLIQNPEKEIKIPLLEITKKKDLFLAFTGEKDKDGKIKLSDKPIIPSITEYIEK